MKEGDLKLVEEIHHRLSNGEVSEALLEALQRVTSFHPTALLQQHPDQARSSLGLVANRVDLALKLADTTLWGPSTSKFLSKSATAINHFYLNPFVYQIISRIEVPDFRKIFAIDKGRHNLAVHDLTGSDRFLRSAEAEFIKIGEKNWKKKYHSQGITTKIRLRRATFKWASSLYQSLDNPYSVEGLELNHPRS